MGRRVRRVRFMLAHHIELCGEGGTCYGGASLEERSEEEEVLMLMGCRLFYLFLHLCDVFAHSFPFRLSHILSIYTSSSYPLSSLHILSILYDEYLSVSYILPLFLVSLYSFCSLSRTCIGFGFRWKDLIPLSHSYLLLPILGSRFMTPLSPRFTTPLDMLHFAVYVVYDVLSAHLSPIDSLHGSLSSIFFLSLVSFSMVRIR